MIPEFIYSLYSNLQHVLTLNPDEPFKTGGKVVAIAGTLFTILTTIATKAWPWLRSKLDSRSVSKRVGAELYTKSSIERAVRYYIQPYCQNLDPAGGEEPRLIIGVQQKLFELLDRVLEHPTEYNFIILLADSGMGKTSALTNYYVRHLRRWRKPYNLALIPLGIPDADERIEAVQNKSETVLFLDALDEDTLAIVDHVERLRILLKATHQYQRVLISCRTQFFSKDEEIPRETGKLKVGTRAAGEPAEYMFHKIYLSPFTDRQVGEYLRRRYPFWKLRSRRRARTMAEKIPHLTARPMLLAHIGDLVKSKKSIRYSFELYGEMINAWLEREQGFIHRKDGLRKFSEHLAVDLYVNRAVRGAERIPKTELSVLAKKWGIPLDEWKLSGRSLLNRDAEGNYKFAHRSIMEYLFVKRFVESGRPLGRDERQIRDLLRRWESDTLIHEYHTQGDDEGSKALCLSVEWTDQMRRFLWELYGANADNLESTNGSMEDLTYMWLNSSGEKLLKEMVSLALKELCARSTTWSYKSISIATTQFCVLLLSGLGLNDSRVTLFSIGNENRRLRSTLLASFWCQGTLDLRGPDWLYELPIVPTGVMDKNVSYINSEQLNKEQQCFTAYVPIREQDGDINLVLAAAARSRSEVGEFRQFIISILSQGIASEARGDDSISR
jgi:hypothetical protein